VECVNELFNIPEDTIDLDVSLVNKVGTSTERLYPESNDKYEFETISDMDNLTQEIYKRRFLNSLISGAALYYAGNFKPYFQKVFEINDELPSLYKKIMLINSILLFLEKDTIDISENNDGGKVDVFISNNENLVQIKSEAILFPILLNETIKGLLELSISHGLPEDRKKANYIISKSDFKFAELWDLRLGVSLWERFLKLAEKNNISLEEVGINFFTMDLASISPDNFNVDIKEMLAGTKRGSEVLQNMCRSIINSKEEDEFNDYMTSQQNNQIQITDDDYFEAEELIMDGLVENINNPTRKTVIQEINKIITEEMGVSNAVHNETKRIIDIALEKIKTSPKEKAFKNVTLQQINFNVKLFNYDIKCNFYLYNFKDENTYNEIINTQGQGFFDANSSFGVLPFTKNSKKQLRLDKISVNIISISGTINKPLLFDDTSHEVMHIYDQIMSNKSYFDTPNFSDYQKVGSVIQKNDENSPNAAIGRLLYLLNKDERIAFNNG
ncbi:MAG: hypothetical protein K2H20_01435, partial [Bacilli bacterium]|nr:hypothetical protein [Bacilli bacterium]